MRTFAQKQNQPRKRESSTHARPDTATPRLNHREELKLHLQHTMGNQGGQRMLQTPVEELKTALTATASPHFGHDFSRISTRPPVARTIQTKLTINKPGDKYEQEADRVAEHVMRMPEARLQRVCSCGGGCPDCQTEKLAQGRDHLQTKHVDSADRGQRAVTPLVDGVLSAPGQPLDTAARAFMESRFGYDFSQVRVHSDEGAARSARDIAANAYTVGSHIVFGAGQYNPGRAAGGRLLAHELTHVIQQNGAGMLSLQRDERKGESTDKEASQQPAAAKPEPGSAYFHLVVRDPGLDLGGGVRVSDLADAKSRLMRRKVDKPWTLVLSIHASENRLGAQSPPDWQKNAIFYDASDIKELFGGDSAFVAWRDQFGPNRVVLYGCQVTAAFEQTIANNLARGGKATSASGLGEGCKPLATMVTFGVASRLAYDKLAVPEKEKMLSEVQTANTTWGYYGGPPVPNDQVLDFLFKGPNPGSWPQVEVIVKQGDKFVSTKPPIPYWNRLSNSTYLRQCTKAVGNLREHTPKAPTLHEGE